MKTAISPISRRIELGRNQHVCCQGVNAGSLNPDHVSLNPDHVSREVISSVWERLNMKGDKQKSTVIQRSDMTVQRTRTALFETIGWVSVSFAQDILNEPIWSLRDEADEPCVPDASNSAAIVAMADRPVPWLNRRSGDPVAIADLPESCSRVAQLDEALMISADAIPRRSPVEDLKGFNLEVIEGQASWFCQGVWGWYSIRFCFCCVPCNLDSAPFRMV